MHQRGLFTLVQNPREICDNIGVLLNIMITFNNKYIYLIIDVTLIMRQLQIRPTKNSRNFVTNIDTAAKELHISPNYMITYIGQNLGIKSNYNKNSSSSEDRAYICGRLDMKTLSIVIQDFIEKLVLCQNCSLPELIFITDICNISLLCQSCGYTCPIEDTKINDKFVKYVYNNPPLIRGNLKPKKKNEKVIIDNETDKEEEWSVDTSDEAVELRRKNGVGNIGL